MLNHGVDRGIRRRERGTEEGEAREERDKRERGKSPSRGGSLNHYGQCQASTGSAHSTTGTSRSTETLETLRARLVLALIVE